MEELKKYFNKNEQGSCGVNAHTVSRKGLLSFLIKEAITDSQVGVVVIHNEENRLHSMDLTVDKKMETICFPKNADELARILEMYGKGNNND